MDGPVTRPLVVDALRARPSRAQVRRFWKKFAAAHPRVTRVAPRARRVALAFGAAVGALGVLSMVLGLWSMTARGRAEVDDVIGMSVMGVFLLFATLILAWAAVRTGRRQDSPRDHWALAHFAADNGLDYEPGPLTSAFAAWRDRGYLLQARAMRTRGRDGRPIEWVDYELRSGGSAGQHSQFGGWIAIALRRPLPHIVLQASDRGTRMLSPTGTPESSQRLSLEGDFDRHFTLYCPTGYERDGLYLFTPDVMARVIDEADGWDIEIVDDRLMLVRSRDVVTTDPREWFEIFRTANAFADKLAQWERWRDDRVGSVSGATAASAASVVPATGIDPGSVAPAGRRLRTTWAPATWVWIGTFVGLLVVGLVLVTVFR